MKPIFMRLILIAGKTGGTVNNAENKREKWKGLTAQKKARVASPLCCSVIIILGLLNVNRIRHIFVMIYGLNNSRMTDD